MKATHCKRCTFIIHLREGKKKKWYSFMDVKHITEIAMFIGKKWKKKEGWGGKKVRLRQFEKWYFSDCWENCSTHYSSCIEGKSRFSRLFVAYRARFTWLHASRALNRSGNTLAHNQCTIQAANDNSSTRQCKKFVCCNAL